MERRDFHLVLRPPVFRPPTPVLQPPFSTVTRSRHDWHFQASAQPVGLPPENRVWMYGPLLTHFPHSSILVFLFFLHTDKNGEMTGFIIGDKMPLTRDIVGPVRNAMPTGHVFAGPRVP